jgi:hypothetical protein
MGMKSYAISAFCIHNANLQLILPKEFYECCRHIQTVWKGYLPIQTTCVKITALNLPVYWRRLKELHLKYIRRKGGGEKRLHDPLPLLKQFAGES